MLVTLNAIVTRACSDVVYRRRLRYDPARALAEYGLWLPGPVETLPIRHHRVSVTIDAPTLFGLGDRRVVRATPPFAARLVLYGVKPAALLFGPEGDMSALLGAARHWGLHGVMSPYEFQPMEDRRLGSYVNQLRDQRPAESGSGWWRGLLLGHDESQVTLAWLSLLFDWHELLGNVLGYPSCCAAAFAERWDLAVRDERGEVAGYVLRASRPPPYDWRLNVLARYFGDPLVEHFPCTFTCQASIDLASRYDTALKTYEPRFHAALRDRLLAPILCASDGLALFQGASVAHEPEGASLSYRDSRVLLTAPRSRLARTVGGAATLRANVDGGSVRIGRRTDVGTLVWFEDSEHAARAVSV